jgi:Ca-activated chloride channel family protein
MRGIITAGIALVSLTTPQQTFRVSVEAVRVDVLVTDGNRPVGGLEPIDFELRDSGVVQRLESVSFEDVPLSVMLAVDASSSVRGRPLEHLKQAGLAMAGLLRPDDRAALVTFSEEIDLSSQWTGDHQELARAIERTRAAGSTALHDAAYVAMTLKDPQAGRLLVLMFSDGDDTASWLSGQTVIDIARRSDAVVYSVGLRPAPVRRLGYLVDFRSGLQLEVPQVVPAELTKSFLATLAEETGGKYINAERSDRLRETFVQIVTEFRSRYLLTYIPAGVDAGGWHRIDVKLKNKKGTITARRGYLR